MNEVIGSKKVHSLDCSGKLEVIFISKIVDMKIITFILSHLDG